MAKFKREFTFKENIMELISKNVRKFRKISGITQEQLAIDVGISPDYLRRFETTLGREGMTLKTLYKISVVLNVNIDNFFEI